MNFIKKRGASVAIGAVGGLMNGLLGAGGGIVIVFYLSRVLGARERNEVFANALAVMLPISLVSLGYYLLSGYAALGGLAVRLVPVAVIGGAIGSFLLVRVKFRFLSGVFSLLVVVSGLIMVLG